MEATDTHTHDAATNPSGEQPSPSNTIIKRKKSRNLLLRSISALAVLGGVYGCLRWDISHSSGWAWAGMLAFFSLLCMREFYRFAIACDIYPFRLFGYITGVAWMLLQEWELSGGSKQFLAISPTFLLLIFTAAGTMLLQLTRRTTDNALGNVGITLLGVIYCSILPGLSVHFRHLQLVSGGWPMHGIEFAVTCIFVSKVSDVGALLTGSQWGKHKLIPRLSPGKTWEGAIGGLIFSIALLQFMAWVEPSMALNSLGKLKLVLLSFLLAAGGLAGDLIESAFKRNSRRKDAGAGVPGFGGVLDLTDSLMIASPVMYFFLIICGAEYVQVQP